MAKGVLVDSHVNILPVYHGSCPGAQSNIHVAPHGCCSWMSRNPCSQVPKSGGKRVEAIIVTAKSLWFWMTCSTFTSVVLFVWPHTFGHILYQTLGQDLTLTLCPFVWFSHRTVCHPPDLWHIITAAAPPWTQKHARLCSNSPGWGSDLVHPKPLAAVLGQWLLLVFHISHPTRLYPVVTLTLATSRCALIFGTWNTRSCPLPVLHTVMCVR